MSVKQSTPHLHLSNINDMYGNPGEYAMGTGIIYFVHILYNFRSTKVKCNLLFISKKCMKSFPNELSNNFQFRIPTN